MVGGLSKAKDAWQKLYSKRGLHYGGTGDILFLEPHLRKGMLAMDAGCGDGKTTEVLLKKCDVVACDFSREALMALRSQRDPDRIANLVECNILKLPFGEEKFDVISCVHTLSHMVGAERVTAAKQLSAALKTDGFIFIEVFGRGDIRCGEGKEIEDFSYLRGDGIMTHYFQEGEVQSLFRSFEIVMEVGAIRRVTFGAVAGKRDVLKVLMRKHGDHAVPKST
ncbi:MAG: class I SAM-dependent methyltransferase [Candidatus Thermoplasmatota archaeon]|nr:class I SAM-dependent methyltransferase [Candidatus Thermoplasmatota archaeon]